MAEVGKVDDRDILAAAFLHDVLEDTNTTPEEIRERFGPAVEGLVLEVTDDKTFDKDERKRQQVEHAPKLSSGAKLLKIADKASKVREVRKDPPKNWDINRRREYFDWAKQVVNSLGSVNPELEAHFAKSVEDGIALVSLIE